MAILDNPIGLLVLNSNHITKEKKPMNICMLVYRVMPQDIRRVIVASSIQKKYKNIDVFCIREKGQPKYENIDGINYFRVPIFYAKNDSKFFLIVKYFLFPLFCFHFLIIRSFLKKYDIIHVHNPPDFFILAAIPFRLLSLSKIILDLHDMLPESVASNLNVQDNSVYMKIAIIIERLAIHFSDAVICTNIFDKEIILARNRIQENKIFVVMNSPDLSIFKIETADKALLKLNDKFIILYEGTIWKRRGIQTIIEAISLIKDKIPIYLIVIGDGPDLEELKEIADSKNLKEYILFLGWVDLKTLSKYISISDICTIPFLQSKVNDRGVPNKLFEYIVHEKPVVTSRLNGISRTFDENEVLFFTPGDPANLADKIVWCYNNVPQLKQFTDNAKYRYYKEYTWDKMENNLHNCYDSLSF